MKKSQYEAYFHDMKVTVMGIGLLGRGVGDIDFIASCGADIIATDLKSKKTLQESLKKLKKYKNIDYTFDRHLVGDFRERDIVIYAGGVSDMNKYLEVAKEDGVTPVMSFTLLMSILKKENINVTVIGVTGTKGKSTTTGMIESILKASNFRYHLAGNIRGVANLPLLRKIKDGDIILAELDSWQLHGLHRIKYSPDIAVFTNFFEDHMNYYKGSMRRYFRDKSAIFKYQKKGDHLVLTKDAQQAINTYFKGTLKSTKQSGRFSKLPKSWNYHVFGSHNQRNLALAYEVGKILDIKQRDIKEGLTQFPGVEGRFQYLGTSRKRNLVFINDNNSTTPASTIESLTSVEANFPGRNIVYIGGGADKDFSYDELSAFLPKHVRYAFLFPGKATEKICEAFPDTFTHYTKTLSMRTAFNLALREAEDGDVIILSPAAASFGLFSNEYERNDQYMERVKRYLRQA